MATRRPWKQPKLTQPENKPVVPPPKPVVTQPVAKPVAPPVVVPKPVPQLIVIPPVKPAKFPDVISTQDEVPVILSASDLINNNSVVDENLNKIVEAIKSEKKRHKAKKKANNENPDNDQRPPETSSN